MRLASVRKGCRAEAPRGGSEAQIHVLQKQRRRTRMCRGKAWHGMVVPDAVVRPGVRVWAVLAGGTVLVYYYGRGVEQQSFSEAVRLCRLAAAQGQMDGRTNPSVQYDDGVELRSGKPLPCSRVGVSLKAVLLLKVAAALLEDGQHPHFAVECCNDMNTKRAKHDFSRERSARSQALASVHIRHVHIYTQYAAAACTTCARHPAGRKFGSRQAQHTHLRGEAQKPWYGVYGMVW